MIRKRKTGVKKLEHSEQVSFVKWFRAKYPHVLIFAIPNGAKFANGPTQWAILKAEGAVAGIPDLMVPEWKLVIEMKRPVGGVVSEEQLHILQHFNSIGWCGVVCDGFDKARSFIEEFVKRMPPSA
jgi:hypothetical protein